MGRGSRAGWLKALGLAGLLGAVAAGAVLVNRRRRTWHEYEPEELRKRLHARLDSRLDAHPDAHRRTRLKPRLEPPYQ